MHYAYINLVLDNQWVRDAIERAVELVVDYILPDI